MAKLIFPPLSENAPVPPIPNSGEWIANNGLILGNLAEGINVAALDRKAEELISIPDIWARTAVVTNALYDDTHSSHKTIQGEWRGLLALFALQPYHRQTIETKIVNLENLKDNPYQVQQDLTNNETNFAKALYTIMPEVKIGVDQSWHEIGIIKLDTKPIGLLTPSTLVCPSRSYSEYIENISWFESGMLTDPCEEAIALC